MKVQIPTNKPSIIDSIPNNVDMAQANINALLETNGISLMKTVDLIFWWCVDLLHLWGDITGLGYNLLNIMIFILLQPALILIFFILRLSERTRKGRFNG